MAGGRADANAALAEPGRANVAATAAVVLVRVRIHALRSALFERWLAKRRAEVAVRPQRAQRLVGRTLLSARAAVFCRIEGRDASGVGAASAGVGAASAGVGAASAAGPRGAAGFDGAAASGGAAASRGSTGRWSAATSRGSPISGAGVATPPSKPASVEVTSPVPPMNAPSPPFEASRACRRRRRSTIRLRRRWSGSCHRSRRSCSRRGRRTRRRHTPSRRRRRDHSCRNWRDRLRIDATTVARLIAVPALAADDAAATCSRCSAGEEHQQRGAWRRDRRIRAPSGRRAAGLRGAE